MPLKFNGDSGTPSFAEKALEVLQALQHVFECLDIADDELVFPETVAPIVISFLVIVTSEINFVDQIDQKRDVCRNRDRLFWYIP